MTEIEESQKAKLDEDGYAGKHAASSPLHESRFPSTTEIERLRKAIRDLHGCDSRHIAPIPVHETYKGEVAWEGNVELFVLLDHPRAKEAFGWSYQTDDQQTQYVTVLALPPLLTASDAVRAYIAVRIQKRQSTIEYKEILDGLDLATK